MSDFQVIIKIFIVAIAFHWAPIRGFSGDFFVSTTGSDSNGNGTQSKPWKTLGFACAKVPPGQGHTIKLSEGIFVERRVIVPTGVSIAGAGRERTILKADPSIYHHPADPGFSHDKFLIDLSSNSLATGNQSVKELTIDGDEKKLHGGILVKNRTNVLLKRIKIERTNFTAIWLWEVKDSRVSEVIIKNCAWGSAAWSSGAIDITNLERVELDNIQIDENFGYGIKALGTNGPMHYVKVHDNKISVAPFGQWKTDSGADAPNIAVEFWNVDLLGCEFYNNDVDNVISLVMDKEQWRIPKGSSTIRVYNNIINLEKRAKGYGYALEVSVHDIEIDHNYILKGSHGIVNWDKGETRMSNWTIHHNIFYGISDHYPTEILRAQNSGLHNIKFYNNTVEFSGTRTTNLIAVYGGTSENIEVKNNLIINSNTSYTHYPNKILHSEKGTFKNVVVTNNFLSNQALGSIPGKSENNKSGDPKLKKAGNRPLPYYLPQSDSPVIDSGVNVGLPFEGSAPDIGAHETFFQN
ncbi:MAG TPA: right-handed parallel beta-helix repeat-containing protein [Chryseolinea sp.]